MEAQPRKALGLSALATPLALGCILALAVSELSGTLTNACLNATVATMWGYARELSTLITGLAFLAIALAAQFRPRLLDARVLLAVAFVCLAGMVPLLLAGSFLASPVLFTVGLVLRSVTRAVTILFVAYCLLKLPDTVSVAGVVVFGMLIDNLLAPLMRSSLDLAGAVCVMALTSAAVTAWGYFKARGSLAELGNAAPASQLAAENPRSFIRSSHALFYCILLFSVGNGYALTFNEVNHAPAPLSIEGFLIVVLIFYLLLVRDRRQEDTLFSFSVLLFMAGLLMASFVISLGQALLAPNVLIHLASDCFNVLVWLVIVGVGKRNFFAFLPVFGLSFCMKSLGTTIGAIIGHGSNDLMLADPSVAQAITLAVAFFVFAFLWTNFRDFSFTDTIFGVEHLELPQQGPLETVGLEERCAQLAREWGLTKREQEIFVMLARGRNGAYIQEHFTLSRNTVKSHIKHIYSKLGVHSHQELIDLVEGDPAPKE